MSFVLGPAFEFGTKLIDKLFTSDTEKKAAQLQLLQLAQSGELETMKIQMSAIIAEAQSSDKWTSRARPMFLYMCYVLILSAVPMGIVAAFDPGRATAISAGFESWLKAIPGELYALMGAGYLGYSGLRTREKEKGVAS